MFWFLVEDTWLSTLLLQLQQMPRLFRGEVEAVADQPTPFDRVSGAAPPNSASATRAAAREWGAVHRAPHRTSARALCQPPRRFRSGRSGSTSRSARPTSY